MKTLDELARKLIPEHLLSGEIEICVGHLKDMLKAGYSEGYQAAIEELKILYKKNEDTAHGYAEWLTERGEEKGIIK